MSAPTKEEMRKEAVRRLETAGVDRSHTAAFSKDGIIPFAVDSIAAEYGRPTPEFKDLTARIEDRDGVLIYYGIETVVSLPDESLLSVYTLLYVPPDKEEWDESVSLTLGEQKAYVISMGSDQAWPATGIMDGEILIERVLIKNYFGGLVRIK